MRQTIRYTLVQPISRIVREMSATQAVERAATLEDIRADVLAPERLNAFVLAGFAGVALLIAVVGVAGVLAFGVSARTREFGVRLAIGSTPRHLLLRVVAEGVSIVVIGLMVGVAGGYVFAAVAAASFENVQLPGAGPCWCRGRSHQRRHHCVDDACGSCLASGCAAGPPIRVVFTHA